MVREALFAKASDFYDWDQWKCRKDQLSYDYLSDLEKGSSWAQYLYLS